MADKVLYREEGAVARITLNRPEQRNAQDTELLDALDKAWSLAAERPAVRVIVLDAAGPHFSAGHDMSPEGRSQTGIDYAASGMADLYRYEAKRFLGYSRRWRDVPKPSIAAVQGACVAAGLMLCWPCDLIVAADNAWFSDPVVRLGIGGVEYHGHTWELGPRKAKEMLFLASRLSAADAERLGMVNRVVPADRLTEETLSLANEIAQMHPFALAMAKRAVNQTMDIMGQYAAIQAVFDAHQVAHGNAFALTGSSVIANLEDMKSAGAPPARSP